MDKDLYAVLGVARDAEGCVIRAAYRALCQQHHPDKMASAAHARMCELNEAYGVLGDEEKRRTYDALRPGGTQKSAASPYDCVPPPDRCQLAPGG